MLFILSYSLCLHLCFVYIILHPLFTSLFCLYYLTAFVYIFVLFILSYSLCLHLCFVYIILQPLFTSLFCLYYLTAFVYIFVLFCLSLKHIVNIISKSYCKSHAVWLHYCQNSKFSEKNMTEMNLLILGRAADCNFLSPLLLECFANFVTFLSLLDVSHASHFSIIRIVAPLI